VLAHIEAIAERRLCRTGLLMVLVYRVGVH